MAQTSQKKYGCSEIVVGGRLSSAQTQLTAVLAEVPENADAASCDGTHSRVERRILQAEAVLSAVQTDDATVQSQIALRKALVALQAKDFSKAKEVAPWFPRRFAMVLAAEISLMDGEYDEAITYCEKVGGAHRALQSHLKLLDGTNESSLCRSPSSLGT